jgi:hypothetical protein
MDIAMQIDLEHDEIVTLITLLTEHLVKTFPGETEDYTHPDSPLCLKLHDAREQYIKKVKSNRKK